MIVLRSSRAASYFPEKHPKKHFLCFTLLILSGTKPPIKYGPNKLGKEVEQQNKKTILFEVVPKPSNLR